MFPEKTQMVNSTLIEIACAALPFSSIGPVESLLIVMIHQWWGSTCILQQGALPTRWIKPITTRVPPILTTSVGHGGSHFIR